MTSAMLRRQNQLRTGLPAGAQPKPNIENVRRAAEARRTGTGGRVMGGLGVGPDGNAQAPMMNQQVSVSGVRGRRAQDALMQQQQQRTRTTMARQQTQQPQQQQLMPQTNAQASGGAQRMLLTYNGAAGSSLQTLQSVFHNSQAPHPKLFEWAVELIDVNRPRLPPDAEHIVRKLQSMREFQQEIQTGCVLFDRRRRVAYKDVPVVCQVVQAEKDALVSALVDAEIAAQQNNAHTGRGAPTNFNEQGAQQQQQQAQPFRPASSVTAPGGGGLTNAKSIRDIARRSVLRGANPEELQTLADQAAKHVRRTDGGGGGGGVISQQFSANATGGGGGGVGGTLFDGLSGGANAATNGGGAEGSIVQINAKAYGR